MERVRCPKIFSQLLAVFFCFVALNVHEVFCETLQCDKRHIANNLDLDELYNSKNCMRQSEGQNLTSSECTVWDFSEGVDDYSDCSNLFFSADSARYLSSVQVHPYTPGGVSNLNIAFRNIKWHYMQYRQRIDNMVSCQKMQLNTSVQVHPELYLSFACNVWGYWTAGHEAELLVDVGESPLHITEHAHLLLKIPEDPLRVDPSKADITNWIILVAVDVARKPYLVVHWPAVPEKFGVTKYNVQLGDSRPEVVDVSLCPDGYCSWEIFAGYASHTVSVSIQPVHELCVAASCRSFSPGFKLEFTFPFYFILMIVVAFILCFMIIICSVYYFCCAAPKEPPSLLMLYDATEAEHCRVVCILAEYLQNVANIRCWLADSDVPLTESQNSSKWLHEAFRQADAVLIVASPKTHLEIRFSLYPSVLHEALTLIKKRQDCPAESESQGRYLVAIPPYCSAEDIPEGLEDLPRILLPDHLSFLVWSVYNQQSWQPHLACIVKAFLLSCWCPGPTSAYRKYGGRLAEALKLAKATQMIADRAPPTPISSRITTFTLWNPKYREGDSISMTYEDFPGNLSRLLSGSGSIISEESAAHKTENNIDSYMR